MKSKIWTRQILFFELYFILYFICPCAPFSKNIVSFHNLRIYINFIGHFPKSIRNGRLYILKIEFSFVSIWIIFKHEYYVESQSITILLTNLSQLSTNCFNRRGEQMNTTICYQCHQWNYAPILGLESEAQASISVGIVALQTSSSDVPSQPSGLPISIVNRG